MELMNYDSILKNGINRREGNKFVFREVGLKNILTSIACAKLNSFTQLDDLNYIRLIKMFSETKLSTFVNTRNIISDFINVNRGEVYNQGFNKLLTKEFAIDSFVVDVDLDDFVSENIIDEINLSYSKWFDLNCISKLSATVFKDISFLELDRFANSLLQKDTLIEIDNHIKSVLKDKYEAFDNDIYILLLKLFNYQKMKPNPSQSLLFSFGIEYRKQNYKYSKEMKVIQNIARKIIDNGLTKRKGIRR